MGFHIHTIGDGALVVILGDDIAIEKPMVCLGGVAVRPIIEASNLAVVVIPNKQQDFSTTKFAETNFSGRNDTKFAAVRSQIYG